MVNDYFIRSYVRANARIVCILASLSVLSFGLAKASADFPPVMNAVGDLQKLSWALEQFHSDNGRYPTQDEGLAALVAQPKTVTHGRWNQLLTSVNPDPWGKDFVYVYPGVHHPDKYDLYSVGQDGISRTGGNDRDDVDPWNYKRAFLHYKLYDESSPQYPKEYYMVPRLCLAGIVGVCLITALISASRKLSSKKLPNEHPA